VRQNILEKERHAELANPAG